MKNIKVVRPLKSSQKLREEASQPMLQHAAGAWKPPAKSGWTTPAPKPAGLPELEPERVPSKPVAYSAPGIDEAPVAEAAHPKYVTGSTLAVTKMPLPRGVYVVVALTVISLVLSLFRVTDNGVMFAIVMFFDLLASVGLLLQLEFFRKMLMMLSLVVVALAGVALFGQKAVTKLAFVGLVITVAISVGQVVYVIRPKVRAAFETLKT